MLPVSSSQWGFIMELPITDNFITSVLNCGHKLLAKSGWMPLCVPFFGEKNNFDHRCLCAPFLPLDLNIRRGIATLKKKMRNVSAAG